MKFELLNFGYSMVTKFLCSFICSFSFLPHHIDIQDMYYMYKNKIKFFELPLSGYTYCKAQCQGRTDILIKYGQHYQKN